MKRPGLNVTPDPVEAKAPELKCGVNCVGADDNIAKKQTRSITVSSGVTRVIRPEIGEFEYMLRVIFI
jgi:hypothetical protein